MDIINVSEDCSYQFEVVTKWCPRCRNPNLDIIVDNGWIEWSGLSISHILISNIMIPSRKCAGQFQIQEEDPWRSGAAEEIHSPASYNSQFLLHYQIIDNNITDDLEW